MHLSDCCGGLRSTTHGGAGEPEWRDRSIQSLGQFFARYAELLAGSPGGQKLIRGQKAEIRFLEYDWALNDVKAVNGKQ